MRKILNFQFQFLSFLFLSGIYSATAQEINRYQERRNNLHHETIDDAYIPNAHGNKKVSPGYKLQNFKTSNQSASTIYTTQVNVNSLGQNIIDDAANEPSIAINPLDSNDMVIGWRQFDNIASNFRQAGWSFTTDAGQSWTFPGVIEPGIFRSDPVLDYDVNGVIYYNSLTNSPSYMCKVFRSSNGGTTWDTGVDAAGGDKQWMAIDRTAGIGNGNIYSFWSTAYSVCPPYQYTRSTDGGNSYNSCSFIDGDPALGTMVVGNSGELYVAGVSSTSDSLVVAKSLNAQNPGATLAWNAPSMVFMDGYLSGFIGVNPVGLLGQINIDVDRSNGPGQNNVYVLASITSLLSGDPADIIFVRSTDGGLTWSQPMKINDDISTLNTQWFGTMSVAPNGRIDAIWLDTREDQSGLDSSALYYSYSTDQGVSWSANEKMSALFDPHVGYPNQQKMGDYFDMESHNDGAHLAWANTLNGEQDVYYSFIVPPVSTAINEINESLNFTIYPNPTNGQFKVTDISNVSSIELYSTMGFKIYSAKDFEKEISIDLSKYASGIYFLKFVSVNGKFEVKKIIKE